MIIDYDLMAKLAKDYPYQYEIEDLFGNLIANQLDKDFDFYIGYNENNHTFTCDSIGLKVSIRDVKDYNELYDMIKNKIGNNDDVKIRNKFSYIVKEFGIESKIGEFKDYSYSSFNTMGFFDLLWFVKTNEMKRDGSIGYELMNDSQDYSDKYPNDKATFFYPRNGLQYQIRYGEWIDMTTVDAMFSGWSIKFFKNGKIQMKGISTKDWDKIITIFKICENNRR